MLRPAVAGLFLLSVSVAACDGDGGDDSPSPGAGNGGAGGSGGAGNASGKGGGSASGAGGNGAGGSPAAVALAACKAFCAAEETCDADTTLAQCEETECVNPVNPSLPIAESPPDCQDAMGAWWTCLAMLADPCDRDGCATDGVASACF